MPQPAYRQVSAPSSESVARTDVPFVDQLYAWTGIEEERLIDALYNETAEISDEDIYFFGDVVRSNEEDLGESNFFEYLYGMGIRHRYRISADFIGRAQGAGRRRGHKPLGQEILGLVQDITAICRQKLSDDQSIQLIRLIRRQLQANIHDVTAVKMPDKAPELYENRPISKKTKRRETIIEFLERVWFDPWIKARVLTRSDFRRLDPGGETRLRNWLIDHELPPHLHLPTKTEVLSDAPSDPASIKAAHRLLTRHRRRAAQPS